MKESSIRVAEVPAVVYLAFLSEAARQGLTSKKAFHQLVDRPVRDLRKAITRGSLKLFRGDLGEPYRSRKLLDEIAAGETPEIDVTLPSTSLRPPEHEKLRRVAADARLGGISLRRALALILVGSSDDFGAILRGSSGRSGSALAIRAARNAAGLTQTELGRDVGLSKTTIISRESGAVPLKPDEVPVFAKALGCDEKALGESIPGFLGEAAR